MGRGLAGETESMAGGVTALLHRGRREGRKANDVADRIDMRQGGLKILVDFQPAALVGFDAELFQPEILGGADAAAE